MIHKIDLNGTWKARWFDGDKGRIVFSNKEDADLSCYIDAQVPGEIHLDAMRQGLIPDIYAGANILSARWVEECIWSYRREFVVPAEALKSKSWLVFEGLDLTSEIVLNGESIGKHNNTTYPCRIEVTGKLREGKNLLIVHVDSGLFSGGEKTPVGYKAGHDHRIHKSNWHRKPQCQFGWDWAPRLVNVGIFKPVYVEWTKSQARLENIVPLATLSDDLQKGTVKVRAFTEGLSKEKLNAKLCLRVVETGRETSSKIEINPGANVSELVIEVDNPKLWWPRGHGSQNLYTINASISIDDSIIDEKTKSVGFRRVNINQDPHPKQGRYFIVEINGKKIFIKGGNIAPPDIISARIDRERYDKLTDLAVEANYNFLRIWGGGSYASDDFYELCDEKGILVWQEFLFACAKYPGIDEEFYNDFKKEAVHNIKRLANHPSLIIWCGNNEMEWGAWSWGYDKGIINPDYALFHLVIPRLLSEEDPTRFYLPSSPYSPDVIHPNDDTVGDQHPWSVGFGNPDFRDYRKMICRFSNEGGILGSTSLPTMYVCLPEDQRFINSLAWQLHDNSINSASEPRCNELLFNHWLGIDPKKLKIDEFAYWAGLLQGEGLREYTDNFRRRMFDSACACNWSYNDTWPVTISWALIDYYLRRNPSFYPVKRAMAPISVVVAQEDDDVKIFGINDNNEPLDCELRYGVFNISGGIPIDRTRNVTLNPNASTELAHFKTNEWKDVNSSSAFAMLVRDEKLVARNRLFLPTFKELNWTPTKLKIRLEKDFAIFESSGFVWGICIDLYGDRSLPDNFFDVYPDIPYAIPWHEKTEPKVIKVGNLV